MTTDRSDVRGGISMKTGWQAFDLEKEIERQAASGTPYLEFLRSPSLSCGIYTVKTGGNDLQGPHDEDEIYYVLKGRAQLKIEGERVPVGPGSILYVRSTAEHTFFEVEEDMTVVVFFATGGPG